MACWFLQNVSFRNVGIKSCSFTSYIMRMRKSVFTLVLMFLTLYGSLGQNMINRPAIKEMRWSGNYELYIYLLDDSTIVLNAKDLPHSQSFLGGAHQDQLTLLPVNLDNGYVHFLQKQAGTSIPSDTVVKGERPATLWSSLHESLGGGYVHFIHCLQYSLETGYLDLKSPLMKRPASKWRPRPATKTWKRTQKWEYYTPDNQKYAIKEYKLQQREGRAEILSGIPEEMISFFLKTSDREYEKMEQRKNFRKKAEIDLIRLLLGSPYLGAVQISYIHTMVMKSVTQFSAFRLPAVIIMDEYNAAVAMLLDERGYRVDQIVFSDDAILDAEIRHGRIQAIKSFTNEINQKNNQVFENRLKKYFGK
mgnify:FL=1